VDTIVVPNTNVVRKGVVIRYVINLGCGSCEFSMKRNFSKISGLPMVNTRVVGTPQMVFINPIMTTHVHETID
jgi:hypothetical protein